MNIFALDSNPVLAARYHCDKHVVKMIIETAQLLSTAHHVLDPDSLEITNDGWVISRTGGKIYNNTHANHPCAVWARERWPNYVWLHELGTALCAEYTARYNRIHKTQAIIHNLRLMPVPLIGASSFVMTPFPLCMPDECKIANNPVQSYRNYYRTHKRNIAQWKCGNTPSWFNS